MALSKSINLLHAQRAVPCDICEDEIPGKYYCIECKQTLCPQCEKNHKKVAATKNHNIVLRTQVGDIDSSTFTCTDHGDQASFYCEKCNIAVCTKCVTGKHRGHNMSDLNDILEKEKRIIQDDIEATKRTLTTLMNQREEIVTEKGNYKKKIKKILTNMEVENQAVMKEVENIHQEKVNNLLASQDSHMAVFDGFEQEIKTKIISCEKRISEYEDTIAKNTLPALRNFEKGKLPLPEISSKPNLPGPPIFVPGKLLTLVENMRKPLKLTTPITVSEFIYTEGYPRICITKEGDVWLGGNEARELEMVDIKGNITKRRKIKNRPASLAVMDSGDVVISPNSDDSRLVSILMKDGKEQHVYDTSPSYSFGISVTSDQKILICTVDGRVVRVNGDGTNAKQIYKNGPGEFSTIHALESSDGNIYITDRTNHAVVIVSKDGKVLSTITHTAGKQKIKKLTGLVVDRMHNILCSDSDNHCVYIIDQKHQMRELVGRSHGIKNPNWLAVDNDDNLWITQANGTIHVVKYLSP